MREFRSAVGLRSGHKDIYSVPLPDSVKNWDVSGSYVYAIKGIEEEYFSLLNKTMVKQLPKKYEVKRRIIDKATKSFKKDESGSFVYEDIQVPTASAVVISDVQIGLPYKQYVNPPKGYMYVDFTVDKGSKVYIYALPKDYLYKVNQTALVVSVKDMKNFWGRGYLTWDSGKVFLHVIPYNPNAKYVGSKILKTGTTLDYSSEVKEIIDYWQKVNLIPNVNLCALSTGENLCLKSTVVGYDSYIPIEPIPVNAGEIYGSEG